MVSRGYAMQQSKKTIPPSSAPLQKRWSNVNSNADVSMTASAQNIHRRLSCVNNGRRERASMAAGSRLPFSSPGITRRHSFVADIIMIERPPLVIHEAYSPLVFSPPKERASWAGNDPVRKRFVIYQTKII